MGKPVSDGPTIDRIIADCERYWVETRVPRSVATAMGAELESHLHEAAAAGKAPAQVVGQDLARFAETWATEFRSPIGAGAWREVQHHMTRTRSRLAVAGLAVAGLATIIVGLLTTEETVTDNGFWLWLWVGAAVVLGVGEMVTAGFFLLPFAVAAVIAGLLALAGVDPLIQLVAFAVFSVLALVGVRRFANKDADVVLPVGAKRYANATGIVTEVIDPNAGTGRVRVETEQWRATTDLDQIIDIGTPIKVLAVRGARMVVEPL